MNLALLKCGRSRGSGLADAQRQIETTGDSFFFDLGNTRQGNFGRIFKDPDGVIFDISQRGWAGTDGRRLDHTVDCAFFNPTAPAMAASMRASDSWSST